jgi:hypothetical protein
MQIAVGDIVKMTDDHSPVTRGEWFRVLGLTDSVTFGPCADMMRVEHFPGPDWPRGAMTHLRTVPVAWLKRDETRTKSWREAVA